MADARSSPTLPARAPNDAPASLAGEAGDVGLWPLLVSFLGAPLAWALHLGASYLAVAWACSTGFARGGIVVGVLTVVFALAALACGWAAWRAWKRHGADEPRRSLFDAEDHVGLLLALGVVLSLLFTAGIVLAGLSPLFAPLCTPGSRLS